MYIRGWVGRGTGVGWVVVKAKGKKQDYTNSRIKCGYDMYIYPQRISIPLQGLNRRALTVGAYQVPTAKLEPSISIISPVADLHSCQKALWNSRPVDISQWRQ